MSRIQYSIPINQARLMAVESGAGGTPLMRVYGLAEGENMPALVGDAPTGYLIAEGQSPDVDWLGEWSPNPETGVIRNNIRENWILTSVAVGLVRYARIYDATGTVCHVQGDAAEYVPDTENPACFWFFGADVAAIGDPITLGQFCLISGNVNP
ncbi:MAG: hypothetical protein J0L71_02795 [Candidatus Accumulibacter sp.]|nr:hypothetical protein [Accumulibacter sp.]